MIDPYRMVIFNILSTLVLLSCLFVYRYIYPRKKINLFCTLILISFLPVISILRKGSYESGGFTEYVKFSTSFYQSLQDGNIIPVWDAFQCGLYGCPIFHFMYIFPYYVVSLFHFLGFSFIDSIKLLLSLGYVLSGITMYHWIKAQYGNKAGFVGGTFYLFAPFHLIDLHFRADIAHILTYVFIPLNFLLVKKIIDRPRLKWIVFQSTILVFLITSHQAIATWSFIFITCYGILLWSISNKKNIRAIAYFILSLVLGILLSAFYWLPILLESKYIFWGNTANVVFEKINLFLYSPWKMGFLFQGPHGELSFLIGSIHLLFFFFSILLIVKKKIERKIKFIIYFFILSSLISFFMTQEVSRYFWETIPIIKNFQFPYRLLVYMSFSLATIAGIYSKYISSKKIIVVCFLVIFSTILNWGHRRVIPAINDKVLQSELYNGLTKTSSIIMPVWVDYINLLKYTPAREHIEILEGDAIIKETFRNSTKHEYVIHVKKNTLLKENTLFFPGWTLKVNNKIYPIDYLNKKYQGVITFSLKEGAYKIEFLFLSTTIRTISSLISIITFLFIACITGFIFVNKLKRKYFSFIHH